MDSLVLSSALELSPDNNNSDHLPFLLKSMYFTWLSQKMDLTFQHHTKIILFLEFLYHKGLWMQMMQHSCLKTAIPLAPSSTKEAFQGWNLDRNTYVK